MGQTLFSVLRQMVSKADTLPTLMNLSFLRETDIIQMSSAWGYSRERAAHGMPRACSSGISSIREIRECFSEKAALELRSGGRREVSWPIV